MDTAPCDCPIPDPPNTFQLVVEIQRAARAHKEQALALLRCYDETGASPVDIAVALEKIRDAFLPTQPHPPHRPKGSGFYRDEWDFLKTLIPIIQAIQADGQRPSHKAVTDRWPGHHQQKQIEHWFHRYVKIPFGLNWEDFVASLPDFIRVLDARSLNK